MVNGNGLVNGNGQHKKTSVLPQRQGQPAPLSLDEPLTKKFRLLSGAQLDSGCYETRYLIPGLLAAGQPGGLFGAFKTLKTSIAADLMISLASGTPFLGRFPVSEPGRVLFLSGESGLAALQSIARRICAERGLSLEKLDNFLLSPDLPKLDCPDDVAALEQLVEEQKPVCVVIDPAYLAMASDKSRNLFAMGSLLRPLAELCESTGCTILVVHHCKRSSRAGEPATLEDIAWSGFAEFSAQWLLLARRRPFDPATGHHELWLTAGSRVGNNGLWEVDVDEGTPKSADGRIWKTAVRSVSSLERLTDERWVAASQDRNLRRRALSFEGQCQRTLELLAAYPDEGRTARSLRDALGLSGDRMSRVLDSLIEKKQIVKIEDRFDCRRPIVTYMRTEVMDFSQVAIKGRQVTAPDQQVYDRGTGQFSRGIAPAPGAAGVGASGVRPAATRRSRDDLAVARYGMGRDTGRDASRNQSTSPAGQACPIVTPSLKKEEPLTANLYAISCACAAPLPQAAPGISPPPAPKSGRDAGRDKSHNQPTAQNAAPIRVIQPPQSWQSVRGQGGSW
jgi:AAA domain